MRLGYQMKGTEGKVLGHVIDVISQTAFVQIKGMGMHSYEISKLERVDIEGL
jgi:hypothetical protein